MVFCRKDEFKPMKEKLKEKAKEIGCSGSYMISWKEEMFDIFCLFYLVT